MTRFNFRKQESSRYKRVSESYRRPRGFHSKMREHRKGNLRLPEAGFRAPVEIRGFHPCGLQETLVFNEAMLTSLDPKLYAIRISATVSHPKKTKIADGAKKLGLKVLNPPKAREKRTNKVEATKKAEKAATTSEAKKPEAKPKTTTADAVTNKAHQHAVPAKQTKKATTGVVGGTEK